MKKLFLILLILSFIISGCSNSKPPEQVDSTITQKKEVIQNETELQPINELPASNTMEAVKKNEPPEDTKETQAEQPVSEIDNTTTEEPVLSDYCSLLVKCNDLSKLPESKKELIPENGIIYYNEQLEYNEGETVFELLLREMKANHIHLEYEYTPAFNSSYIKGISNLYEFDAGELSGWRYKVNNKIPSIGSSQYIINNKDVIEWIFYCE